MPHQVTFAKSGQQTDSNRGFASISEGIFIGGSDAGQIFPDPKYANRLGLVASVTGTGKTVTPQCLAEGFSDLGKPVFLANFKGDVSGISQRLPATGWFIPDG